MPRNRDGTRYRFFGGVCGFEVLMHCWLVAAHVMRVRVDLLWLA